MSLLDKYGPKPGRVAKRAAELAAIAKSPQPSLCDQCGAETGDSGTICDPCWDESTGADTPDETVTAAEFDARMRARYRDEAARQGGPPGSDDYERIAAEFDRRVGPPAESPLVIDPEVVSDGGLGTREVPVDWQAVRATPIREVPADVEDRRPTLGDWVRVTRTNRDKRGRVKCEAGQEGEIFWSAPDKFKRGCQRFGIKQWEGEEPTWVGEGDVEIIPHPQLARRKTAEVVW